jgi:hypothetical protein
MSVSVPSSVDVEVQSCLTDLSDGTVSQETMVPESSMDSLTVGSSSNCFNISLLDRVPPVFCLLI